MLHWPQCRLDVFVLVSQPVIALLSQSPNPTSHTVEHWELVHCGVPFTLLHAIGQLPQCDGSVLVFVSHPLPTFPSQFPNPLTHAIAQAPAEQLAVPFTVLHSMSQPEQFVASPYTSVSHPLAALPSQSAMPSAQDTPQTPPEHAASPPPWMVHTASHSPQCARSE
jgi:hypothetical protein